MVQTSQADLSGQADTSGQWNHSGQADTSNAGLYGQNQPSTEAAQPQYDPEGGSQETAQDPSQLSYQQNYAQNYDTFQTESAYDPSQTNYDTSNMYNYDQSQPISDSNQNGMSLTSTSYEPAEYPPPTTNYLSDDVTTPRGDVTEAEGTTEVDGVSGADSFFRQRQDTLTNEGQTEEVEEEAEVAPPPQGGFTFFNPNQFG